MTTPIGAAASSTYPVAATTAAPSATGASIATRGNDTLGKDAFLQLLVAQLRYQDPTKPVDSSEFMAQTAQFTSVEKLEQLVASSQTQQRLTAAALTGQQVGWTDAQGVSRTGVVDSVRLLGDAEPTVLVDGAEIPLSSVVEIRAAAADTTRATTGSPSTTA